MNNIEGGKLASLLQTGGIAEGRGQSLNELGHSSGGFADALSGQMESLTEAKIKGELPPGHHKVLAGSQSANLLTGHAEFLKVPGDQPFVLSAEGVLEDQKLPGKALDNQSGDAGTMSAAAMLASLTESPEIEKVADSPDPGISEETIAPSGSAGMALLGAHQRLGHAKELGKTGSESRQDLAANPSVQTSLAEPAEEFRQKIGGADKADADKPGRLANQQAETETENPARDFAAMNVLAPLPAPAGDAIKIKPEEGAGVNHAPNESGYKNTPQSFIKPLFEEFKSSSSGAEPSEGASQKGLIFGQIIKENLNLNENRAENSLLSEGTGRGEAEPSIPEMGGKPFHEVADIHQLKGQPVENRADVPAISKPLAHPDWKNELGERILWMNTKDLTAAEIKLNPQHLGPISVRIEIDNDQATIAFTAQHAAVRDALEASIPKLREMMSSQQLNLADVNISQNSSSNQQHQSSSQQPPRNFDGFARRSGSGFEASEESEERNIAVSKGILSIYA